MTRWKGQQGGDVVIPFGGVGGELKGIINCNQKGSIWVSEKDQFQIGHLITQIQVHQGELQKAWTTPIVMRVCNMLVHRDHALIDEEEEAGTLTAPVQYNLPPQFFKPENQENRVHWNKVFGGAAHILVRNCFLVTKQ